MTQDYWKEQASDFANYYAKKKRFSLKNFVSRFLDSRTTLLISLMDSKEDATILDLGCGSGIHIKLFAERCRQITGVDFSEQMLLQAEKELEGIDKRKWTLKRADAQELPFPDKSFDVVMSMGLLDYVPSPEQVLSECHRVLKDSGTIIFTIPKGRSLFFFLRTPIGNIIRKKIFDLPPIDNIFTRKEIETLVRSKGFELSYIKPLWTTMWIIKADKITKESL